MKSVLMWLTASTSSHDPVVVGFGVLRIGAAVLGAYLVAVTLLGVAARVAGLPTLIRSIDVVTLPSIRRLLDVVVGTSLAVSVLAPTSAVAATDPTPPPVMVVLPDQPAPSPPPARPV